MDALGCVGLPVCRAAGVGLPVCRAAGVGLPGFEPGTSCSQSRRAAKLRYSPQNSYGRGTLLPFCVKEGANTADHARISSAPRSYRGACSR